MKKSKYLVRPSDMHIFEVDESNGCYRSYTNRNVTDSDGNRPEAYSHMNYDNLTQNYHFFPVEEYDLSLYEYFEAVCVDFISWQNRPNGHGGAKGGTFEEFLKTNYRVAKRVE